MRDNLRAFEPHGSFAGKPSGTNSLDGNGCLPSVVELCSSDASWKSLGLRRYRDPPIAEPFDIPPRDAQLVLLVKSAPKSAGPSNIETSDGGSRWRSAQYRDGDIALTPPGRGVRLRWSNLTSHQTVQVLIPRATMTEAAEELGLNFRPEVIDRLSMHDPSIREFVLSIERALERNAGESYAEAAALFLATHLLSTFADRSLVEGAGNRELGLLEDYMIANLGSDISLGDIASVVGITRFRLIRLCKQQWGETPMQHLTRLRMERGRQLLRMTSLSIIEIALECGYTNPSHFAVAFRRFSGVSPRAYRTGQGSG